MNFIQPLFLWGLFAVAIPVIIHLFDFRRTRRVYFSCMMILLEDVLRKKGFEFLDRDTRSDNGYAEKVVGHYGDRIVFVQDPIRTEWGEQQYIRVKL